MQGDAAAHSAAILAATWCDLGRAAPVQRARALGSPGVLGLSVHAGGRGRGRGAGEALHRGRARGLPGRPLHGLGLGIISFF